MNLFGNYTALITPFKKNLEIDHFSLKQLCVYQLNKNTDGIVALGSTAEAPALDSYEKHKVMETICSAFEGSKPIIAGVNAFTLSEAINLAYARFLDGADALLISPPPYIKPTEKGLYSFFEEIADKSFIPIIIYNIPSRTGTNIPLNMVIKLSQHPNIIGIKDAGGDLVYAQNISLLTKESNFTILSGNDNQLLPYLSIGAKGIISVGGNIVPDIYHNIINEYSGNNSHKAEEIYFNNLDFINLLSLETNPIPIKFIMGKLNMIKPFYRPPLIKPSLKTKKQIVNYFDNFNSIL